MLSRFGIKEQDVYITPDKAFEDLESIFHVKGKELFDPCPYPESELDGLEIEWGSISFANPPFSKATAWVGKALQQAKKGKTVYMLLPWYWHSNNKRRHYFTDMITMPHSQELRYTFKSPLNESQAKITCIWFKITCE